MTVNLEHEVLPATSDAYPNSKNHNRTNELYLF